MKNDNKETLLKELMEEGASFKEASDMVSVAGKLSKLSNLHLSEITKKEFLNNLDNDDFSGNVKSTPNTYSKWMYVPALFMTLLIFILSTSTVVDAQASIPGDTLYPLKRLTENIVLKVNPDFNDKIIERRSEEIKKLVEDKNDESLLDSTINDYENQLNNVNKIDSRSVKDSKKNLELAKGRISDKHKQKIEKLILKINEKQQEEATDSADIKGAETEKGNRNKITPGNKRE